MTLELKLADLIAPTLVGMGYELVRVQILGRQSPTVQVMADQADGSLIGIGDCESISVALGALLDVNDPLPGTWTLEVSSAGIDRPLTRIKDWKRFMGHVAKVELIAPLVGVPPGNRKRFSGVILGADADFARLRLEDGTEIALAMSDIRKARLVLTDALIAATAPPAPADQSAAPSAAAH